MATDDEAATEKIRSCGESPGSGAPEDAKEQPGMGVIAQEVEKVFPELVTTDEQGRKKIEYEGLIAPLIEAVKELDDRVQSLEEETAALRGERQQGYRYLNDKSPPRPVCGAIQPIMPRGVLDPTSHQARPLRMRGGAWSPRCL
jgi:hypothetical protein